MWKQRASYDSSDTEALLGRKLRSAVAAAADMAQSLIDLGVVDATKRRKGSSSPP